MQTETKRRLLLGAAAAAVLALGGFLGVTNLTGHGIAPAQAAVATEQCPSGEQFFATAKGAHGNQFGPDLASHDAKTVYNRLVLKLHCDRLFAATTLAFKAHGLNLSISDVAATAMAYGKDKARWKQEVDDFLASIKDYSVVNDTSGSYHTMGMKPDGKKQPTLFFATEHRTPGWKLVLVFKDSPTRDLKIPCDLQPLEDSQSTTG